ncbi:MAG: hypothetical protein AMJ75_00460 [Phycisphaerae bacterium SM1_79]|nr:MAG: hypothetical protein AMJ75_00460 [Phycisphaerae bacterium SM1_79]
MTIAMTFVSVSPWFFPLLLRDIAHLKKLGPAQRWLSSMRKHAPAPQRRLAVLCRRFKRAKQNDTNDNHNYKLTLSSAEGKLKLENL